MKKKIFLLLSFLALALAGQAQDIISETTTILPRQEQAICKGDTLETVYYLLSTRIVDNGTAYPDTTRNTTLIKDGACPADSSEVARQIYVSAVNAQLELSGGMSRALQRNQYLQGFNNASTLFKSLTGITLLDATSEELFREYEGTYRVFTSTGNFFADISRIASGRWRLRQLDGPSGSPTGQVWVMNPRSRNNFGLTNIDLGFGPQNYEMFRDLRPGVENIFWPAQRVSGATGSVRIVKVN